MSELEKIELEGILEKWAEYTIVKFQDRMTKLRISVTRDLYFSFTKEVAKLNGDVDAVVIKFLKYGRFVDMGVGGGINVNELALNRKFDRYRNTEGKMVGQYARRAKKWYSSILFREIAKLKYIVPPAIADQLAFKIRDELSKMAA